MADEAVKLGQLVAYHPSAAERSRNSTLDVTGPWVGLVTYVHQDGTGRVNLALFMPFPDDPMTPVERRLGIDRQGEAAGGIRCWSLLP